MNRLSVLSALGAALLLAALVAVLYSTGGADRASSADAPARAVPETAAAKPLPAPEGEPVLRIKGVRRGNVSANVTEVDFASLDRAASEEIRSGSLSSSAG